MIYIFYLIYIALRVTGNVALAVDVLKSRNSETKDGNISLAFTMIADLFISIGALLLAYSFEYKENIALYGLLVLFISYLLLFFAGESNTQQKD